MSNVVCLDDKRKHDEDELAARFQVIEPAWEKRKRKPKHKPPFTLKSQRLHDIRIILRHRYPDGIPDHIDEYDLVWMDAQTLGDSFGLTAEERKMWKIRTVRPCDATVDDLRRKRDRKGARARRKAKGVASRKQYLAKHSKSRLKPWEIEGISRSAWYARGQVRRLGQVRREYLAQRRGRKVLGVLEA